MRWYTWQLSIPITNIVTYPAPVNDLLTQINKLRFRLWLTCLACIPPRITGAENSSHNLLLNNIPWSIDSYSASMCVSSLKSTSWRKCFFYVFCSSSRTVSRAQQTDENSFSCLTEELCVAQVCLDYKFESSWCKIFYFDVAGSGMLLQPAVCLIQ